MSARASAISTSNDSEANAFLLRPGRARGRTRSIIAAPGIYLEFDAAGRLVSLEVIGASARLSRPLLDAVRSLRERGKRR